METLSISRGEADSPVDACGANAPPRFPSTGRAEKNRALSVRRRRKKRIPLGAA
jgi:hypothetical protein